MELNPSPHLNREWLYQKYIVEKLSTYQIGKLVHRNPKNVYDKLTCFGIQTRTRGETVQQNAWWKQGLPSKLIGRKLSEETKCKISKSKTGKEYPNLKGKNNGMFGKRSHNWKGGVTPERQRLYSNGLWKEIIKQILKKDNYTCERCRCTHSTKNALHTHHIKSWASHPNSRFDLNNLITLCRRCHNWTHSKKNTGRDFLK
mgnify:FL=1